MSPYFPPVVVHDGYGYKQLEPNILEYQGFWIARMVGVSTKQYSTFIAHNVFSLPTSTLTLDQDDQLATDMTAIIDGTFTDILAKNVDLHIGITPFHGISYDLINIAFAKKSGTRTVLVFEEDGFAATVFITLSVYDVSGTNSYKVKNLDANVYCTGSATFRNNLALMAFNTFDTQYADFQVAFLDTA